MRAVRWSAATGTLSLTSIPLPDPPTDQEVTVKVGFSGVCGTDLHIIQKEWEAADEVGIERSERIWMVS